jgi:hypothetical protein
MERGSGVSEFSGKSARRREEAPASELSCRKGLGKSELSSIAFAMKIGQVVITDDVKARELAKNSGHALSQTTPHLFSWLIFQGRFGKSDKSIVIDQHRAM